MSIASFILAVGIVWGGVTPENHLGGRPASSGYLQGKVILVDCRDYSRDPSGLARLEGFWQSYKIKQFVLIGSHRGGPAESVRQAIREAGVSFPVYADATFESKTFEPENGLIYVIHQGGRMAIKTRDMNRAFEAAVSAMTWGAAPTTVSQYRRLIDYELGVLPGKAYNHLKAMRDAFPEDSRKLYEEAFRRLDGDEEVRKVARLEETARLVKDFDPKTRKNGRVVRFSRQKIEARITEAEALKGSSNPLVVQEAKNCIADLKWASVDI